MLHAVELAKRGTGFVNPNPLVGAVIVKDGRIIGEGWHHRYGELHAEREAIRSAGVENCRGADLYVTLEPCCHTGKQPPCTEAIIRAGFARVFTGSRDPNPLVSGKGTAALKAAGIEVHADMMRTACDALNPVFFYYITSKIPYVIMKYAMTADGLTACCTGKSRWVSGEESRLFVHQERAAYMAVMTGIGTVLQDDPLLTCRLYPENASCGQNSAQPVRQPVRIVCDSRLRIPPESTLVRTAHDIPLLIVCACSSQELADPACAAGKKAAVLRAAGAEILCVPESAGSHVDLKKLMHILGSRGIDSILLEGGSTLNYAALKAGIVQKVQVFIAPKLFGQLSVPGGDSSGSEVHIHTPVQGILAESPDDALLLSSPSVRTFGSDVLLEYTLCRAVS